MKRTPTRPAPPPSPAPPTRIRLRPPTVGDIGWVISRHGALYGQEFGWDWRFEAMVARIAADFIQRFDATREACWIAERCDAPTGGTSNTGTNAVASANANTERGEERRLGCVFLVRARHEASGRPMPGVAQLRMLLLEPAARGQGLGRRLVNECERFARERGYRRIRLWTNNVLLAARGIYESAGYQLVATERHTSFGKKMVGEIWELELGA